MLCYVWALEQSGRTFTTQDVFVPWHLKSEFQAPNSENNENKETTFQRYYHIFKKGELEDLFHQIPEFRIENSYYDRDNWCVLAKKIS